MKGAQSRHRPGAWRIEKLLDGGENCPPLTADIDFVRVDDDVSVGILQSGYCGKPVVRKLGTRSTSKGVNHNWRLSKSICAFDKNIIAFRGFVRGEPSKAFNDTSGGLHPVILWKVETVSVGLAVSGSWREQTDLPKCCL